MHLIVIAWVYVVLLMAAAEGMSANGSWLGALTTLLLYGVLPLGIVLHIAGRARRRARRSGKQAEPAASTLDPDGRAVPAGDAVAPVRKEV